jgi:AcrR family transcriptional regulator
VRTRLTIEQRRAQLLEIGGDLFARRPYEQVSIEKVAELAGVSHGLLYRYFPSKQAFFAAVIEAEGERLLHASLPDPALSPLDQIKAGLDVYIDQAENSPSAYRMAHQLGSADSGLEPSGQARNIIQRDRVLNSLAAIIPIETETPFAVTSWLGFTQTAILDWIDNPVISRQQLHELCMRTLGAAARLPN